eukprot:8757876-Alexandrium_andersonii.AAC.1
MPHNVGVEAAAISPQGLRDLKGLQIVIAEPRACAHNFAPIAASGAVNKLPRGAVIAAFLLLAFARPFVFLALVALVAAPGLAGLLSLLLGQLALGLETLQRVVVNR